MIVLKTVKCKKNPNNIFLNKNPINIKGRRLSPQHLYIWSNLV